MDITDIILRQHDEQRRAFAVLEEWPRDDAEGLAALWHQLAILLERHAEAEELYFYPELVKIGTGGADAESNDEQIEDAIGDHNLLRDAIRRVGEAETGTKEWWTAVVDANVVNSDHMGEEERQDLADFRQQASLELRHQIAIAFLRHIAVTWEKPLETEDRDAETFIEDAEKAAPSPQVRKAAEQLEAETSTRSEKDAPESLKASEQGE